jgi:RNA polymerase sigma-70 factor, ECF subfamily
VTASRATKLVLKAGSRREAPATDEPFTAPRTVAADTELIARMTQGDRAALAALYSRHAPTLVAVTQCIVRDRQDAEDVVHDVFLEVWRNCADYSQSRASVRTWLVMRARSRALDRLRANNRRQAVGVSARGEASVRKHTPDVMLDDKHLLLSALAQVPAPQQGVLVLAYFEGLSTAEISSRLGIPAGTVKSRTHAALKTLRNALGIADE